MNIYHIYRFIYAAVYSHNRVINKEVNMKIVVHMVVIFILVLASQLSVAAKKTIGILVYDDVLGSDVMAPAEVFGAATRQSWFTDYQVQFIGINGQPTVTTAEGVVLKVDMSIDQVDKLSVLLVPSRYEMDELINNKTLISFIKEQAQTVEFLASNCSGAFLLAEAGLLDGKKATTWFGGEKDLQSDYPKVNVQYDVPYVVDGNIISSNGSVVSYSSAIKLLEMMSSKKFAQSIFDYLQMGQLAKVDG